MRSKLVLAISALLLLAGSAAAQSSATAGLRVTVKDTQGATIRNATVSVSDQRNLQRSVTANSEGDYVFLQLPPGRYTVTVEATGFAKLVASDVSITVGQSADLPVTLQLPTVAQVVNVTTAPELVETQRSSTTSTIDQAAIDNLPINGRNYINFALTDSKLARDTTPTIGAAPTSGINFGGQRARSNLVNVDGENAVDNSTNGIRSTVSQEAVQEFQIIDNSYAAEYGGASGGVVNIITRSGTNAFHGDVYGYLRNRNIQAVNPFSNVPDPAYTRVQAGATAGGAIKKDKTFYFFSYETTRRQETGFSNIGANNFGLVPFNTATVGQPFGTVLLTPDQVGFIGQAMAQFQAAMTAVAQVPAGSGGGPNGPIATQLRTSVGNQLAGYLTLTGGSSGVALNRAMPSAAMVAVLQAQGIPATSVNVFPTSGVTLPPGTSFFGLNSVVGNFPVTEGTSIYSLRLDHRLNNNQNLMLRVGVSPSTTTGIESAGQGPQNFGESAFSRTADNTFRDLTVTGQHSWTIGNNKVNEFRFQFARRGTLFNYSHSPGGFADGVNIPGYAFLGHEPYSYVDRSEQRYQFTDNFSISKGAHTFKFGGDFNYLPLTADFTVNFGGVYNFGGLGAASVLPAATAAAGCPAIQPGTFQICVPGVITTPVVQIPAFSPVQSYGLGIPLNLIQGVGNPHSAFSNKTLGVFWQDSWRMRRNLTLNYGVRYDVEFTPTFAAPTTMSAAADQALGIGEGIPVDSNNVAPRIGLAWDPRANGKDVIRASYGMFYDHPLLALVFDSHVANGSQAPQFGLLEGPPGCGTSIATALNAVNTFQGILGACPGAAALNYLPSQQRFNPTPNAPSVFTNQQFIAAGLPLTFLPDGFSNASNFQYGYAEQANLSVEHDFGHDFALGLEYNFSGGKHLFRPINANPIQTPAMIANYNNALKNINTSNGQPAPDPAAVALGPQFVGLPITASSTPCGVTATGTPWVSTAVMNFYRRSGVNPSFSGGTGAAPFAGFLGPGGPLAACAPLVTAVSKMYGVGLGVPVPFLDMGTNYSTGSSVYHGFTANLRKRFSHHYQFLASYTWSHAIDDSTDLETPLKPQDNLNPNQDRSNSLFDQRHRFVFSGVYQTGRLTGGSFFRRFMSDWTFAPILEVSSGRPFNIISGEDTNLDQTSETDRPNAVPAGTGPNCRGELPVASSFSPTGFFQPACFTDPGLGNGNVGRNAGVRPWDVFNDLRVAKRINLTERVGLDAMVDMFNLVNRFNVADVNPLWNQAGIPTAAFDPRQFQFALKLSW